MKQETSRFSTTIGPDAGELVDRMATIWNERATEPGERYGRADILGDALAHGLHFLAMRDMGDAKAWDPDRQIGEAHA